MTEASKIELSIASDPRSLPVVRSAVERMARMEGFGDEDAHSLILAIDEALANVIKHGYEGRTNQPIAITLTSVASADGRPGIAIEVRDKGRQVDPKTIRSRELDDFRPGGLGVHIIQTVMDEYDYCCPPEGGMKLMMVKYVSGPGKEPDERSTPAERSGPQP